MERPSRVELLNAAFAVRYSADECWARGRKVGTRTPINGFGDRYATIAPPTYMVAWVGNDPTYLDFQSSANPSQLPCHNGWKDRT